MKNTKSRNYTKGTDAKRTDSRGTDAKRTYNRKTTEEKSFGSSSKAGYKRSDNKKSSFKRSDNEKPSFKRSDSERPRFKREFNDFNDGLILEGRNPVLEAVNSNRTIDKILIKSGPIEGSITVIVAKAKEKGIVVTEVSKSRLDELSQSGNHQSIIAMCPAHEYVEVEDILEIAKKKGEDPFIIILDGITDPHNLGAIMRTADCCGAHGIIIPKRRTALLTGIVSKTSAGAIEYVPVAKVTNISQVIDDFKKEGIWIASGHTYGKPYYKENLKGGIALVIGSEGEGISKNIEKKSDYLLKIPMYGEISSLNASVAAGLLMYEVVRQRKFI